MFFALLTLLLIAAAIHIARTRPRTLERAGEIVLLWVLIGYCGLPMIGVSAFTLIRPDGVAAMLGFPAGNPFQMFFGCAYLGMSLSASLALRYRGTYLIGPAIVWGVFFAGATFVHLGEAHGGGRPSLLDVLVIFGSHGLVTVTLLGGLWASGVLGSRGGGGEA